MNMTLDEQINIIKETVTPVGTERVLLEDAPFRILAEDITAKEDVPPFRRSPLDAYAMRSEDIKNASKESPVVLKVLEEVAAGQVPKYEITAGTASRVMTGAPVPEGSDCVIRYEETEFTDEKVKIFKPLKAGENIILPGEDIKKGEVLAKAGTVIDAGLCGTLSGQNIDRPLVYKKSVIGIIPTGSELVKPGNELPAGKIYDSNSFTLNAVIRKLGCVPRQYEIAGDEVERIAASIEQALEECDAVILTGGVSVGDFDYTPAAMEKAGAEILFKAAKIKPGMSCAYGKKDGKLICALSGNPTSSVINFYVIGMPAVKKLTGLKDYDPEEITAELKAPFRKTGKIPRYICGKLEFSGDSVKIDVPEKQGNVILSSMIGCRALVVIPPSDKPLPAGAKVKAFLI
ncbi:MAG: molybdopterin molybdotransferase MoeA [Lachnospiraceae bacterium]|nr:molybdopterin molybdotransferase MoeA [Lachnospiraceae bacterium]